MEFAQAYQQQDASTMNSALKGIVAGIGMGNRESLKVVILFSGDSGFYSGCQALYHALQEKINAGQLQVVSEEPEKTVDVIKHIAEQASAFWLY